MFRGRVITSIVDSHISSKTRFCGRAMRSIICSLLLAVVCLTSAAAAEEITIMLPGDVPMVLVRVPAGTFMMGSPDGERGSDIFNNEPIHQVTLTRDYYIGKTEITQGQWKAVMGDTVETLCAGSNNVPNPLPGVGDDHPVYCVTWNLINGPGGFLEKLNEQLGTNRFRLPTEAEWERAARADTQTRFFYGDVLECGDDCEACETHDRYMWYCGNKSEEGPKAVGQKEPNGYGLLDMHGNVFEVVSDRYADDYANPSGGSVTDPTGPATTSGDIVFKGGAWESEVWFSRAAVRVGGSPGDQSRNAGIGFRLAACTGPSISSQPSSTSIAPGEEATLSVAATASEGSLSYQWYLGESGDTSSPISGGTSSSIAVSPDSTTSYWVRVSDGCASSDSATATVSLSNATVEIVWPANGMTLPAEGASIKVDAQGFVLDCDAMGGANVAGHGHLRISVDGSTDTMSCTATTALTNLLAPGGHTIQVEVVQNDHSSLTPPVISSVSVDVADGEPTYTAASVVTGVGRLTGAVGSFFKTTVWLSAPAGESAVQLQFVPAPGQPAADFPMVRLTVPDKQSIAFADAMKNAFGSTVNTFGNVIVSVADGSNAPNVTARTFNDQRESSNGTFGQFISEIGLPDSNTGTVRLDGLSSSPAFRTNVGIINYDPVNALSATMSVIDASGDQVGEPIPVIVPPGSVVQTSRVAAALALDPFSVTIEGVGRFSAYASKLDNTTSDPIFILDNASSETMQWIDGVGSVQGGGGTFFKSELSLTNRTASTATVMISLVSRGAATPAKTVELTLAAGESRLYKNAVKEIFDLDNVAGSFWISGPAGLSAWARTYNDLTESGGEGSFGQFIPAFDSTDLIGSSGAIIPGLSQNSEFRTNAGFLNTGTADAGVTVSVWSSDGQKLGQNSYFVPAGTAIFVSQIIADAGVPSLSDGYIKVVPSVEGTIYGWASSVDNVSTDQTFFRPFGLD